MNAISEFEHSILEVIMHKLGEAMPERTFFIGIYHPTRYVPYISSNPVEIVLRDSVVYISRWDGPPTNPEPGPVMKVRLPDPDFLDKIEECVRRTLGQKSIGACAEVP